MKKLLLALCLVASRLMAQEATQPKDDFTVEKNAGTPSTTATVVTDADYGDITVSGTGTVWTLDLTFAPTAATYITQTAHSGLSAEQALGALGTGLLFSTTTTGVLSIYTGATCTNQFVRSLSTAGAATCASIVNADITASTIDLTTKVTGVLPVANGGTGAATLTVHGVLLGQTTSAVTATSAGVVGQVLASGGPSADPTYQISSGGISPSTQSVVFEDLYCKTPTTAATNFGCGEVYIQPSGTGSASLALAVAADGNHPGVVRCSTGSTATGTCAVGTYGAATTSDYIQLTGGEFYETMVWVDAVSDVTNTHRLTAGFQDKLDSTTVPVDAAMIYWDNLADTHWGCETSSNNVKTATQVLSTTVATAAAWHKLRVDVNSNATSIAFKVDDVALSCSPLTANIPTGASRGVGAGTKLSAILGCASNTTCTMQVDYLWFADFITR